MVSEVTCTSPGADCMKILEDNLSRMLHGLTLDEAWAVIEKAMRDAVIEVTADMDMPPETADVIAQGEAAGKILEAIDDSPRCKLLSDLQVQIEVLRMIAKHRGLEPSSFRLESDSLLF